MRQMTLQKANTKRKALKVKLESLNPCLLGFYKGDTKFVNGKTIEEYTESLSSEWNSICDMYSEYRKLNKAIMNALGTVKVKVPKDISLNKLFKSNEYEYEETNIAEAINRKQFYSSLIYNDGLYYKISNNYKNTINKFDLLQEDSMNKLDLKVNTQFNSSSTASAKARKEYEESIKPNYEMHLIDPNKLYTIITNFKDQIDNYLVEIDSIISNIYETTTIEVED